MGRGGVRVKEWIEFPGGVRYRLRSVVRHVGGFGSLSHFDAVVRGGDECRYGLAGIDGRRWWHVDDGTVRECGVEKALDSRFAYLVIYDAKWRVASGGKGPRALVER